MNGRRKKEREIKICHNYFQSSARLTAVNQDPVERQQSPLERLPPRIEYWTNLRGVHVIRQWLHRRGARGASHPERVNEKRGRKVGATFASIRTGGSPVRAREESALGENDALFRAIKRVGGALLFLSYPSFFLSFLHICSLSFENPKKKNQTDTNHLNNSTNYNGFYQTIIACINTIEKREFQ